MTGTKHQRFRIDRAFMRALTATGAYQAFQDSELRGFGVKVTPKGAASLPGASRASRSLVSQLA